MRNCKKKTETENLIAENHGLYKKQRFDFEKS